jgi:hypothetical protein
MQSVREFLASEHLFPPRYVSRRVILRNALLGERPRKLRPCKPGGKKRLVAAITELEHRLAFHLQVARDVVTVEVVTWKPSRRELATLPRLVRRTVYKRPDAACIRVYVKYDAQIMQVDPAYVGRLARDIPEIQRVGVYTTFCGDFTHIDLATPRTEAAWTKH